MCNKYNTNYTGCCGACGGIFTPTLTLGNGCFGCGQRMCRDCCGRIWVRPKPIRPCCLNTSQTTNAVGCVTVCGNTFGNSIMQTNWAGADNYYVRQYGLLGSSCCCGSNNSNN